MENKKELLYVVYKVPTGGMSIQRTRELLRDVANCVNMTPEQADALNLIVKHVVVPSNETTFDVIPVYPVLLDDTMKKRMHDDVIRCEELFKKFQQEYE